MPRLTWGAPEKRFFDTGLDRGVLYPKGIPPLGRIIAKNISDAPRGLAQQGSSTVEVKRNLAGNPRNPLVFGNNTQWITSNNQSLENHPLGFAVGGQVYRNPATNPGESPGTLASVYNIDGMGDTATSRFIGAYVCSTRKARARVNAGTAQSASMVLEANQWYWIQTPTAGASWSGLVVSTFDNGAATLADKVYISGVLASTRKYSYFDGGIPGVNGLSNSWVGSPNSSESRAVGAVPRAYFVMNGTAAIQDTHRGDGVNVWNNGGTGMYTTGAEAVSSGFYYSARLELSRIPGEEAVGSINPQLWDGDSYIASASPIELNTLPADGSPIVVDIVATTPASNTNQAPTVFLYTNVGDEKFHVSKVLIQRVSKLGAKTENYFDGNSTSGAYKFVWLGAENNSMSTKQEILPLSVPWDGLSSVDEQGADGAAEYYVDGRPFLYLPRPKEYKASLKAYTYPDAFSEIMGVSEIADGMYLDSQMGDAFDLSYRTLVGNAVNGTEHGYKIHLVYNATVTPQALTYDTMGDSINPTAFSWDIQAVPVPVDGFRPTAHIIIDTRNMTKSKVTAIEDLLYGSDEVIPHMPSPQTIFDLLSFGDVIIVTDNGDGTFTVEGSYENVYMVEPGVFRVDNVDAVDNGDGTFTISSTGL